MTNTTDVIDIINSLRKDFRNDLADTGLLDMEYVDSQSGDYYNQNASYLKIYVQRCNNFNGNNDFDVTVNFDIRDNGKTIEPSINVKNMEVNNQGMKLLNTIKELADKHRHIAPLHETIEDKLVESGKFSKRDFDLRDNKYLGPTGKCLYIKINTNSLRLFFDNFNGDERLLNIKLSDDNDHCGDFHDADLGIFIDSYEDCTKVMEALRVIREYL